MQYEIDAIDASAGWFSGGHDKVAKEFKRLAKTMKDGWVLHSYDTVAQGKTMYATVVWQKGVFPIAQTVHLSQTSQSGLWMWAVYLSLSRII